MIIVKNNGYLEYKNFKFRCALGKAGVKTKIQEGDNITPKGTYKILNIYYRKDRIKKITSNFRPIEISKDMCWCDDPKSKKYNQLIKLPNRYSHEKFFKKDNSYDLIVILNYNINPIIKNKGSAIFIHIAKKNYKSTAGCIALKKDDLLKLIKIIDTNTKIFIK